MHDRGHFPHERDGRESCQAPDGRDIVTNLPVVLVVDGDSNSLFGFQEMLGRADIEIVAARSGNAALEILRRRDVALALIDVSMPEMDGLGLAEIMRGVERMRYVPIIFVTAGSRNVARVFEGYEAGAVDFLFRPIDPEILRCKVDVFVTLERQRRQLQEANHVRDLFIGILGHDLRNPLNGIVMSAEVGLQYSVDDPPVHKRFDHILDNTQRIMRMIENLLDLTRMRFGAVSLSAAPTNLRTIITCVIEDLSAQPGRFRADYDGDLVGSWDADRLFQIITNIAANANEHSPLATEISIHVDGTHPEAVEIRVHNVGSTIPAELRDVLFEPFRGRARTSGLGLGLFICKQLVLAHGGTIEFESDNDTGTCFRISLPRVFAHAGSATT